ncbi:glutathione transferase FuA class [Trametes coccinea BRFM310]|uniref:Glutathione transferase FuA class n=1 Tax=Trametes coccinea (strain BRFM310) TaxID=1353009 RepID=A0A1Y2IA35_TRAC3|nr:glutathione transferase FuA class [Trametes coccinea BRFM310]
MPEPILFYDLTTKNASQKAWSPNTWKTRYCLNIKGLPYKTIWVEYTLEDITAISRKIGAVATEKRADGSFYHTLPAIYDPNTKTALADSAAIVRYLDKTYPDTPRLIPFETDALHAAFAHALRPSITPDLRKMRELVIPATAIVLSPRSEAYFRATHPMPSGPEFDEISRPGPKRDEHWAGFLGGLYTITQWLEADGTNKLFFLGDKIGYADVTVAAFLTWIRIVLGADSKEWTAVKAADGGRWGRFMEAFEKYETVDAGEDAVL